MVTAKKSVKLSPARSPKAGETVHVVSWAEGMAAIKEGKKITRRVWNNPEDYGFMGDDEMVSIRLDGEIFCWAIALEDMTANDWVIL